MPDGIGPGKGWEVLINGQFRVFLDTLKVATQVAMHSKEKRPDDLVQIRGYQSDNVMTVLANGTPG